MSITSETVERLRGALLFFIMQELRQSCMQYQTPSKGTKMLLIERIVRLYDTHGILAEPTVPDCSKAKHGQHYALMLKGADKNDLRTRLCFKKWIGEYFHFTAFGMDWLNARWLAGEPPTDKAFTIMWTAEYAKTSKNGKNPQRRMDIY